MMKSIVNIAASKLLKNNDTPFYLIDLEGIIQAFYSIKNAWDSIFPNMFYAYSYKTNPLSIIAKNLKKQGVSAEVTTGSELKWALSDGFFPEQIYFNGPAKTELDLREALNKKIIVQVDSVDEAEKICSILTKINVEGEVVLRLSFLHSEIGGSRFGLTAQEYEKVKMMLRQHSVKVSGVHMHVGSNINCTDWHVHALSSYIEIIKYLTNELPVKPIINLGGGFPSTSVDKIGIQVTHREFADAIATILMGNNISTDQIRLVIEPGRCLVEDYGFLFTKVVARKKRNGRELLIMNAGTNLAKSIANWYHPIVFFQAREYDLEEKYKIVGALCYESDVFAEELTGPDGVKPGDVVVINNVGGYDITTAYPWSKPTPPIFAVDGGDILNVSRDGRIA